MVRSVNGCSPGRALVMSYQIPSRLSEIPNPVRDEETAGYLGDTSDSGSSGSLDGPADGPRSFDYGHTAPIVALKTVILSGNARFGRHQATLGLISIHPRALHSTYAAAVSGAQNSKQDTRKNLKQMENGKVKKKDADIYARSSGPAPPPLRGFPNFPQATAPPNRSTQLGSSRLQNTSKLGTQDKSE